MTYKNLIKFISAPTLLQGNWEPRQTAGEICPLRVLLQTQSKREMNPVLTGSEIPIFTIDCWGVEDGNRRLKLQKQILYFAESFDERNYDCTKK